MALDPASRSRRYTENKTGEKQKESTNDDDAVQISLSFLLRQKNFLLLAHRFDRFPLGRIFFKNSLAPLPLALGSVADKGLETLLLLRFCSRSKLPVRLTMAAELLSARCCCWSCPARLLIRSPSSWLSDVVAGALGGDDPSMLPPSKNADDSLLRREEADEAVEVYDRGKLLILFVTVVSDGGRCSRFPPPPLRKVGKNAAAESAGVLESILTPASAKDVSPADDPSSKVAGALDGRPTGAVIGVRAKDRLRFDGPTDDAMDARPAPAAIGNRRWLSTNGLPLDSVSIIVNSDRLRSEEFAGNEVFRWTGDLGEGEGDP
jgi:hypothetical protein